MKNVTLNNETSVEILGLVSFFHQEDKTHIRNQ